MQVCALCREIIEPSGDILTLYFEIKGMGAFELNTHSECLIGLGELDYIQTGSNCVLCGMHNTNSSFLVRQLNNLSYPVHMDCLEKLLEEFASQISDKIDNLGPQSEGGSTETESERDLTHLGKYLRESRN